MFLGKLRAANLDRSLQYFSPALDLITVMLQALSDDPQFLNNEKR